MPVAQVEREFRIAVVMSGGSSLAGAVRLLWRPVPSAYARMVTPSRCSTLRRTSPGRRHPGTRRAAFQDGLSIARGDDAQLVQRFQALRALKNEVFFNSITEAAAGRFE